MSRSSMIVRYKTLLLLMFFSALGCSKSHQLTANDADVASNEQKQSNQVVNKSDNNFYPCSGADCDAGFVASDSGVDAGNVIDPPPPPQYDCESEGLPSMIDGDIQCICDGCSTAMLLCSSGRYAILECLASMCVETSTGPQCCGTIVDNVCNPECAAVDPDCP